MSFQESRLLPPVGQDHPCAIRCVIDHAPYLDQRLPPVGRIRIHVATATRTFSIDGDLSLHPALFDEIVADMLRRLTPEGGTP